MTEIESVWDTDNDRKIDQNGRRSSILIPFLLLASTSLFVKGNILHFSNANECNHHRMCMYSAKNLVVLTHTHTHSNQNRIFQWISRCTKYRSISKNTCKCVSLFSRAQKKHTDCFHLIFFVVCFYDTGLGCRFLSIEREGFTCILSLLKMDSCFCKTNKKQRCQTENWRQTKM